MKSSIFSALALAIAVSAGIPAMAGDALACPRGGNDQRRPVQRPVVQNVSFQASALFERAQQLETAASARERQAVAFDRDAETLANRARVLRNQAQLVSTADRASVVAIAEELTARASLSRAQAAEERGQAADLRSQARSIRERALQLVKVGNGGGGWRGTPVPLPRTTAETTI